MKRKPLTVEEMKENVLLQGDHEKLFTSKKDQELLDMVLVEIHDLEVKAAE